LIESRSKQSISLPLLNLLSRSEMYDHEILQAAAKLLLTSKGRKPAQECERQWHLTGACECSAGEKVR
jgi:hypothetical protein